MTTILNERQRLIKGEAVSKRIRHTPPTGGGRMLSDIAQILSLYQKAGVEVVGIYAISDKGRLEIQELNLTHWEIDRLRYNRLKELNMKGEGIYFAPKTDTCNLLFLDDPARFEGLPRGTMVVQTSAKKHQFHIPYTGEPAPTSVRTQFQRYLGSLYNSDKGAVYANHQRRLPGFINPKYPDRPLVKILYVVADGNFLSYDELWEAVRKQQTERVKHPPLMTQPKNVSYSCSVELKKRWSDFFSGGDKSVADIKYTLYLLRKGLDEGEVRIRLINESLDIAERKKGHLDDYLNRTIRKAKSYLLT
jgi:hypothetical protein